MTIDYFPLGLALGKAFCNRKEEIKRLLTNIEHSKPTLIMSPRRYGKTSLALNTINRSNFPFAHIDFFSEISQLDVEKSIMKAVGDVISKILPTPQRALKAAQEFFSDIKVKLAVQPSGTSIEFDYLTHHKHNLKNILLKFDTLAQKHRKKVIIFMDEFQRLGQLSGDISIEATIRQVAQQSQHIAFIFSGSNRHLLQQMFEDKNRPFYKLCDKLILERIAAEHYEAYIQFAAKQKWQHSITEEVLESILTLPELHPYYVNLLCSRLWLNKKVPTKNEVEEYWEKLAVEDRSQASVEIDVLSNNQRKLLISLARYQKTLSPLNKEFAHLTHLSTSSIAQALAVLEQKDYIYRDHEGYYHLVDPLMKRVLSN